jgi:hypothetical protein
MLVHAAATQFGGSFAYGAKAYSSRVNVGPNTAAIVVDLNGEALVAANQADGNVPRAAVLYGVVHGFLRYAICGDLDRYRQYCDVT